MFNFVHYWYFRIYCLVWLPTYRQRYQTPADLSARLIREAGPNTTNHGVADYARCVNLSVHYSTGVELTKISRLLETCTARTMNVPSILQLLEEYV